MSATFLSVTEFSCRQEARRIFLRAPGGDLVVLESLYTPAAGLTRSRITDDRTGWWAELLDRSELKVNVTSPHQYGNILFWQRKRFFDGPFTLARSLSVKGREVLALESNTHDWELTDKVFTALSRSGAAEVIVAEMPQSTARAVLFLRSTYEDGLGHGSVFGAFTELVGALAPSVEAHGDPAWSRLYVGVRWTDAEEKSRPGIVAEGAEETGFLGGFETASGDLHLLRGLEAAADGGCAQPR